MLTPDREPLADLVRERRRDLTLTQAQLAKQAGVSRNFVVDIEAGRSTNPGAVSLERLANALGLPIQDLLGGAHPPPIDHVADPAPPTPTKALLQFCASDEFARRVTHLATATACDEEKLAARLRQLLSILPTPRDDTLTKADYRATLAFVAALVDR